MIRDIQVNTAKSVQIVVAAEALKRGMAVSYSPSTGKVSKATAENAFGFVDVAPNYDGINAVITPNDSQFEDIAAGAQCLYKTYYQGERIATNQVAATGLAANDKVDAAAGILTESAGGTEEWVYCGAYSDPDFTDMHIFQHV